MQRNKNRNDHEKISKRCVSENKYMKKTTKVTKIK